MPRRRLFRLVGVLILVLSTGGCGLSTSPSDPADAGKALQEVLEAWKGSEKPGALAERTPPIHVSDEDWMTGLHLQSYRVEGDGRLVGSDVNFNVALELKSAKGKVVKKTVVYAVTTSPQILVLRQESL